MKLEELMKVSDQPESQLRSILLVKTLRSISKSIASQKIRMEEVTTLISYSQSLKSPVVDNLSLHRLTDHM
jgi:hypothetical protein